MKHREGTFLGAAGLRLYYQSWHPQKRSRAIVVIVHGLGGHSDLFANLVQYLVDCGDTVYGFDLRGNGRSPGQRSYINSWTEFREDLEAFVRLIEVKESDSPCFLLGHSLGATIVLDYVLRSPRQWQGVILIAPALGNVGVSPLKLAIGRILSKVWPRFSLDTGIDLAASSRDPQVLKAYAQDPLRHSRGTARLATEFLKTVNWIEAHASELQVPLLILHGGADRVTLPESSRLFFERVTFADKEKREYPGAYHEIFNDLDYQQILCDLKDWLERHLERATRS